jgi:glycosyltransferase involved in cell wall biosynthesis
MWPASPSDPFTVSLQKSILRSRWWRAPVTVYGEWPGEPRHVIPFFTSVLNAEQMERARLAAACARTSPVPEVLFVGRLTKAKNVDVLVEALAVVRESGHRLLGTIVGDGPERPRLEGLIASRDLGGDVRLLGGLPFDQVLGLYERADVLVLASETEGWPKALAEGMAFGLVCVGSNRGLVPRMLGEGRGFVVEPGDVRGLADALTTIATSPKTFGDMRAKSAAWAQRYSLEDLREELRRLLEREWGLEHGELEGGPRTPGA